MGDITTEGLFALLLAAAGAVTVLYNAGKSIASTWKAAKAPGDEQNARLAKLEARMDQVEKAPDEEQNARLSKLEERMAKAERKLENDMKAFEKIHEGLRASYQAQLALLDHGIDGNNIKQMQDAKEVLQNHLINR